jgi:hypothetical protein
MAVFGQADEMMATSFVASTPASTLCVTGMVNRASKPSL